jgi:hypothetical protein
MLPQLVGVHMADQASNTLGGGIRNYLGAGGFLVMMFGGYFLYDGKPTWIGITLIAVGLPIFLAPWMWGQLTHRQPKPENPEQILQYLSRRDSELSSTIVTAALRSAYGRWYAAQILVNSGSPVEHRHLISTMANAVMGKIVDGDIEVRGRKPGQITYEPIPRTYWQLTIFYVVEDLISLWKVKLGPKGGIEFPSKGTIASNASAAARTSQLTGYDSLIVDAYQFEKRFPRMDPITDKETRRFLWKAFWRRLDKNERRRLSGQTLGDR